MMNLTDHKVARSDALVLTGYFLSRCTVKVSGHRPRPPACLASKTWSDAYDLFYPELGAGRTKLQFRNTLRNTRDTFDPLFENGRRGWHDDTSRMSKLSERDQTMHDDWKAKPDDALRSAVLPFCRPTVHLRTQGG